MYVLERIFESRVWIFLITIIVHVIGIAVLEAHNEASRIAVLIISSIWLLFIHIYAVYIGYRLWADLAKHAPSHILPTHVAFEVRKSIHRSKRDRHSLWVWIDMFIALTIAWAFWSQSVKVMWEDTFETPHKSHNEWVAMLQWWDALARVAVGEDRPYETIHPALAAIYMLPTLLFKVYELTVLAIGIAHVWEHIHNMNQTPEMDGAHSTSSSSPTNSQDVSNRGQVTRIPPSSSSSRPTPSNLPPPDPFGQVEQTVPTETPFWNPTHVDELGFTDYLNTRYYQQHQGAIPQPQSKCVRMGGGIEESVMSTWMGGATPPKQD